MTQAAAKAWCRSCHAFVADWSDAAVQFCNAHHQERACVKIPVQALDAYTEDLSGMPRERPSLRLGDALEVEGLEYVVVSIRYTVDGDGRSVDLHCRDPLLAQVMRQQAEEKQTMMRKMLEVADKALDQ